MMLDPIELRNNVKQALREDLGSGDLTASLLSPDLVVEANIISREAMLVCGQPWVEEVFSVLNNTIELTWLVKEGSWLEAPRNLCKIKGPAAAILTGERTALNFMQILSGTATQVYEYLLRIQGTHARLLDTRKTIPGLRMAQKYAVVCGGGMNHRMGLYDAFLIKENHIKSCGSITAAVNQARSLATTFLVEVEVENLAELEEALEAQPDRILLDNFSYSLLLEAVKRTAGRCPLEVSGGINLNNIRKIAETGVDYISVGAITKSVHSIDLSLLLSTN